MMRDKFKDWLETYYLGRDNKFLTKNSISSILSRCYRIEEAEGDLDSHYNTDNMLILIDKLTYTQEDYRTNARAKHQININGNILTGTASLKKSAKLYKKFRIDT